MDVFWNGFYKQAGLINNALSRVGKVLGKTPLKTPTKVGPALNYKEINKIKTPANPGSLNYGEMNAVTPKAPAPKALYYGAGGSVAQIGPGKSIEQSKMLGQQKAKDLSQKQVSNATKGGYTESQYIRAGKPGELT
jgi:hypothetical protein